MAGGGNRELVSDPSLQQTLTISGDARKVGAEVISRIEDALAPEGTLSKDDQMELSRMQRQLFASVSHLRGLNRAAQLVARSTKSTTADARHEVDRLHLQLQNLYYEQRHLQGEIDACESYDHTYQQLPLIPIGDFLAQCPEFDGADDNALMVARIDHERVEREALEQQRQELLKRKQRLIADNKKRKDDLANLDKDLEKFIDAAKPIQKLFEKVV